MDEVYRQYRIAVVQKDGWSARITHVRGNVAPFTARATLSEGHETCLRRARELVDRYVEFLGVAESAAGDDHSPDA